MDIPIGRITRAALVQVVEGDGRYLWSSDRSARKVARYLRGIADDVDAVERAGIATGLQ